MIDAGRHVARFEEEELTREVKKDELDKLRVDFGSLCAQVCALVGGVQEPLEKLLEELKDIELERAAREEERKAREKDGVCSQCGVLDGAYDSFSAGACNCSE